MQSWKYISISAMAVAMIACGGGGGGSSTPASSTTSGTTYSFVTPAVNAQLLYAKTIIDNSNNTINETIQDTVTAVNSDGSFVTLTQDPTHNSITINGTVYSVPTETTNINNADHDVSYTYTPAGGTLTTCTFTPQGPGPNYPLSVGETWSSSWNLTCGSNTPIAYTQTGTIVDTESVTVPAGTYTTLKFQSTIIWTDENGTTHTDARTTWKDVNGAHVTIKEEDSYSYTGTPQTHSHPVTTTLILQSQS